MLVALGLLAVLAPLSLIGSDLPRLLAWSLAVVVFAAGLWQVRHEAGRAPRDLVLATGRSGTDSLDGEPLRACDVTWRGPLAFVHAVHRDGRSERLAWWPDTLPAPLRRELRLAVAARAASRRDRPMAP